jgi:hypothetical protein
MPNKSTTPTKPAKCTICGKLLTNAASIGNAQGHKCAQLQANYTAKQLATHKARYTLPNVPNGYVKTAIMHQRINAAKANGLAVTVSAMVKAFGGDRGLGTLANPICRFYYVTGNKARYIHGWFASPQGLQALATGNWANAPKPPTKTQLVKGIKANKVFYTG